jgi:hypothetical protein
MSVVYTTYNARQWQHIADKAELKEEWFLFGLAQKAVDGSPRWESTRTFSLDSAAAALCEECLYDYEPIELFEE